MSPRAAWRLEELGFKQVYDFVPGKMAWLAMGWSREGRAAAVPNAGEIARRDTPRGPHKPLISASTRGSYHRASVSQEVRLVFLALVYLLLRRVVGVIAGSSNDQMNTDVELVVLRHQLMVLKRNVGRPQLRRRDRLFMAAISRVLPRTRWSSFLVSPKTLLRCQDPDPDTTGERVRRAVGPPRSGRSAWTGCSSSAAGTWRVCFAPTSLTTTGRGLIGASTWGRPSRDRIGLRGRVTCQRSEPTTCWAGSSVSTN